MTAITGRDALLGAGAATARVQARAAQLEAMRQSGMSEVAIRRALGLSETEAIDCGLAAPAGWPRVRAERAVDARHTGPTMMDVVEAVASASGLDRKDLLGRRRTRPLARARHLAMFLVRELCPGASLPAIGYLLDRDHSTVLHGCRRAATLLEHDAAFRRLCEQARRDLVLTTAESDVTARPTSKPVMRPASAARSRSWKSTTGVPTASSARNEASGGLITAICREIDRAPENLVDALAKARVLEEWAQADDQTREMAQTMIRDLELLAGEAQS